MSPYGHVPRPEGHEQRKHPRVAVHVKVDVASGANFWTGTTRDLSLGGLFVETAASVAVGMPLVLRVELLGKLFEIAADVVWVLVDDAGKPAGCGVRFRRLSAEAKRRIEAFTVFREPMRVEMGE